MAEWKKVIVSGSDAILNDVDISGTFTGDGSGITGIVNASIASNAAIAHSKLAALAATKVLVGNGSNVATEVPLSGDVTMDNAGAVTIGSGVVEAGMIASNAITNAKLADNAVDTAEIAASAVETSKINDDAVTAAKLASNAVVNASIAANAAIAHSKLAALASTKVLVGNGSNVATEVPLSGDVTMANTGAVTIGAAKVVNSMIGDGAVDTQEIADDAITAAKLASAAVVNASVADSAAIAFAKLAALAATKVLVGNGSNVATAVPLSGDVTMNNAGAVTIANNAVDGDKLADSVTVAAELTVAGHGLTVKQISASAHISGTLAGDIIGFASGSFLNVEASNDIKAAQFFGGGAGLTGVSADIDGLDALGGTGVAQGDHFIFSDAGTEKKITFSNLEDAIFGNVSGDATIAAGGALTIANTSVETGMIADDAVTAAKLASNAVVNASIAANAAIAHSKLAALASTKVLVGNGSNVAVEVPLSGDVTMANTGAVTIANDAVVTAKITDANVTLAKIANAAANTVIVRDANSAGVLSAKAVATTEILIGDGTGFTAASLSGDVTMDNTGAVTIGSGVVETGMIADSQITVGKMAANSVDSDQYADGSIDPDHLADDAVTAAKLASNAVVNASIAANAAIAHSKLAALASTKVLVGNGSNVAAEVPLSGDVTMANTGAVTIGANKVTLAKMAGLARGKIISGDASGDPVALAPGGANTVLQSDGTDITYGTVATAMIGDAQITAGKMAANSIDSDSYVDGSIDTAHVADNAITGDKLADDIVIAGALTVTGDLLVSGDSVTVNTANLNVEDAFILLNSGSSTISNDSGIVFGGTTGTANSGKAIIWDASYNTNDGRLAVSTTAVAGDATANFGASTAGYYVAGVFEGTEANAATALADHAGNIRIESSEIYIYV